MAFIKFCNSSFHPSKCDTLKIGTLHEFRAVELGELHDRDEGRFTCELDFGGGVEVSAEWFNTLSQGGIHIGTGKRLHIPVPGSFSTTGGGEGFYIEARDSKGFIAGKLNIDYYPPDAFIFCMSKGPIDMPCPFNGYNDRWAVREESLEQLGNYLVEALIAHHEKFGGLIDFNAASARTKGRITYFPFNFVARFEKVRYGERRIVVRSQQDLTVEAFENFLINAPFTKPTKYSHENEVRFLCAAVNKDLGDLPIYSKPAFLESSPLRKILENQHV